MYLTQGIHRAVQRHPERTAIVDSGAALTYRELQANIARLAAGLHAIGVGAGERVAMLGHNSNRYVEFFFGTWWAGAVASPINTRWSVAEIVFALEDCATAVLIVDDAFLSLVPAIRAQVPALRAIIHCGAAATPAGVLRYADLLAAAEPAEDLRRSGDDLAAILYTGGTTGRAKGVMLSHANFWSSSVARMAEVTNASDGVSLIVTPLFHVAGLGRLINAIVVGSTCVLQAQFRPDAVLDAMRRHQVTDIVLVPSMIKMLLDDPSFSPERVAALQRVVYGAAPIAQSLLERVLERMPQVEFLHTYGMTETAASVTINPGFNNGPEGRRTGRLHSAGRCGYGAEMRIVDADGIEVPRAAVGEIVVRGPMVMLGYWNRPEETRAAFRDGWFCTGDGAWMDDAGYIFVVERMKDMIISGGENVYSAEVENAIIQHPAVLACAVIGVPHDTWGEAVHAVIVPRQGFRPESESIQDHCRGLLASYKCPKTVEFRDTLPMSAAGKVLKNNLRDPYWQGQAKPIARSDASSTVQENR